MFRVWQVVSYVLQGRLEEARQMLVKQATLQPAARKMYKLMDALLSKMPFYNVSGLRHHEYIYLPVLNPLKYLISIMCGGV